MRAKRRLQRALRLGDCAASPRAADDRPDVDPGHLVHVIYLVPSDAPDRRLDTDGRIDCSVRAQMRWFIEASEGLAWRIDTFVNDVGRRAIDITFVRAERTREELVYGGAVADELRKLGFADRDKRYLSYVQAGDNRSVCGDAIYPLDPTTEPVDGRYAQVYLESNERCGAMRFGVPGNPSISESIAQQELMHNDGLTPVGAPHTCAWSFIGHICTSALMFTNLDPERFDVMYPIISVPLSEKVLDIGHDDYYGHPWPIRDLSVSYYLKESRR